MEQIKQKEQKTNKKTNKTFCLFHRGQKVDFDLSAFYNQVVRLAKVFDIPIEDCQLRQTGLTRDGRYDPPTYTSNL